MATKKQSLYVSGGQFDTAFQMNDTFSKPVLFAATVAAVTLTRGTPIAKITATNKWVVWTNGGAGGAGVIQGFLKETITTDTADDVIGVAMLEGVFDYASIILPAGETEANLKTALLAQDANGVNILRGAGIKVTGLDFWG